jgi:hypothetical protein
MGTNATAGGRGNGTGGGAGMVVYELTDTGLALTAGVAGTRYWRDQRLEE